MSIAIRQPASIYVEDVFGLTIEWCEDNGNRVTLSWDEREGLVVFTTRPDPNECHAWDGSQALDMLCDLCAECPTPARGEETDDA